jgi:head-tail adaptor
MSAEFAGSLRERVIIERLVSERTAIGVQASGWEMVARCLASIVPEGAGPEAEGQALSAMPKFRVTIRKRDGIAIDQRLQWGERLLMIRQMLDDPRLGDRHLLRCEEVRA